MNGQLFFFQDSYGFLSYRCVFYVFSCLLVLISVSVAINSAWEPAVRICQAATATPIAATTWSNCADVRLYFQDKTKQIREFSITFGSNDLYDGNWCVFGAFILVRSTFETRDRVLGALKISGCLTSSMAAISWPGPQIRYYCVTRFRRHLIHFQTLHATGRQFSEGIALRS